MTWNSLILLVGLLVATVGVSVALSLIVGGATLTPELVLALGLGTSLALFCGLWVGSGGISEASDERFMTPPAGARFHAVQDALRSGHHRAQNLAPLPGQLSLFGGPQDDDTEEHAKDEDDPDGCEIAIEPVLDEPQRAVARVVPGSTAGAGGPTDDEHLARAPLAPPPLPSAFFETELARLTAALAERDRCIATLEDRLRATDRAREPAETTDPRPPQPESGPGGERQDDRGPDVDSAPEANSAPEADSERVADREPEAGGGQQVVDIALGFHQAVEAYKRDLIRRAVAHNDGNRAAAARDLGLQRTYLYRLMKKLEV